MKRKNSILGKWMSPNHLLESKTYAHLKFVELDAG